MAGPQNKSKPFKGKKPIKDLREFKSREIKKSLVHRARLRKNYFKLLEQEGELPPASTYEDAQLDEKYGGDDNQSANDSGSDEEVEQSLKSAKHSAKTSGPLPPQRAPSRRAPIPKEKRPSNFAERTKLAKNLKDEQRAQKLAEVKSRIETKERQSREREKRKERLTKKTRRGQPLMGPRINNLLDKIKENNQL